MTEPPVRRTTIVDVAKAAGVSAGTVSNALSGRRYVDPATKARIVSAAEALSYTPSVSAQRMRSGRSDTIGLFLTFPLGASSGPSRIGLAMEIAAVAASEAAERGLALMLVPPVDATSMARFLDVDGAIFIEPPPENPVALRLRASNIPVVSIGSDLSAPDQPYVDIQTYQGTTLLLEHLRERGCSEIAFIGSVDDHDLQRESWRAFSAHAATSGSSRFSVRLPEIDGIAETRREVRRLLALHPSIDGIIAPYDPFAVGAYEAVLDRDGGPGKVKVATRYDGARVRELGITALALDLPAISTAAVKLLLSCIEGVQVPQRLIAPEATLIIRGSS